jgi:hypothetical protein
VPDDFFGDAPTQEEFDELRALYDKILTAGYEIGVGPSPDPEDLAALDSLRESSARLAAQLQDSILYAPWARQDIQSLVNEWMQGGEELSLTDLRAMLEPIVGEGRALLIARSETGQVFNASFAAGMRSAGYNYVRWIAAPNACSICLGLDGTVMTIAEYEADPAAHPNCSCTSEPADDEEYQSQQTEEEEAEAE